MPSFYCCSLNCRFFFFIGIEKGMLSPFILVFSSIAVFVFLSALLTQFCNSCSWLLLSVLFCTATSRLWNDPENTSVERKLLVCVVSACDGGEMKTERKRSLLPRYPVLTLLLWPETRSLWVDERWWETNTLHTTAVFLYQCLENIPYICPMFFSREWGAFPICFTCDFRGNVVSESYYFASLSPLMVVTVYLASQAK